MVPFKGLPDIETRPVEAPPRVILAEHIWEALHYDDALHRVLPEVEIAMHQIFQNCHYSDFVEVVVRRRGSPWPPEVTP